MRLLLASALPGEHLYFILTRKPEAVLFEHHMTCTTSYGNQISVTSLSVTGRPVWAEMQCNLALNGCRTAVLSGGALVILEVCSFGLRQDDL